ncbi:MAG: hypothetical protein WDO24_21130 [Pseudomonadota bacterium]
MFEHSPFETTVYLDADTVVLGRLDYGFEMAERFGLACCHCVNRGCAAMSGSPAT